MFSTSPIAHYKNLSTEGGVSDASPHQLILLLMEGALIAINMAKVKINEGNVEERGNAISKAISIIDDGLRASLNLELGGEIAQNLDALYDYMARQLFIANLKKSPVILDQIYQLLSEIKQAWESINNNQEAQQINSSISQRPA